jgi:hypothetical protein
VHSVDWLAALPDYAVHCTTSHALLGGHSTADVLHCNIVDVAFKFQSQGVLDFRYTGMQVHVDLAQDCLRLSKGTSL